MASSVYGESTINRRRKIRTSVNVGSAPIYGSRLLDLGVRFRMSGKGRAWENLYAERAIGHLKDEEIWLKEYSDFRDAYTNLSYFLDVFYNHNRIHSSLGYLTPAEFESQYWSQRKQYS